MNNYILLIEDMVLYAMRQRAKKWKRQILNVKDDDPDIERIFTPAIGKSVLHCAKLESWSYMGEIDTLVQEVLLDKEYRKGKLNCCLISVGMEYLDYDRIDTLFSYCGMIVEMCCYCFDRGYTSLIEVSMLAASMAMDRKFKILMETDHYKYHRYAIEYNKVYEDTFPPGEQNLALNAILELDNELLII